METMDKDMVNEIAKEAFLQAEEGLEIALDPDLADAMGAFEETALSPSDADVEEENAKE